MSPSIYSLPSGSVTLAVETPLATIRRTHAERNDAATVTSMMAGLTLSVGGGIVVNRTLL
jgi:uncharacterized ParB-like nuclease family protein